MSFCSSLDKVILDDLEVKLVGLIKLHYNQKLAINITQSYKHDRSIGQRMLK